MSEKPEWKALFDDDGRLARCPRCGSDMIYVWNNQVQAGWDQCSTCSLFTSDKQTMLKVITLAALSTGSGE